ncbi:hypothetical protein NA56DRAFT_713647 [Hyaloscypha hepaticicola]|uniref:Uncharacterized protein n=1 Tax=Hyaloscypha hepaticicola TaxID=2082293 RepID=A0A2J6PDA7_9HELO|nr:hypothetical protein NA56DRAFT_713647 [Hyaloscypha hepaticicola]
MAHRNFLQAMGTGPSFEYRASPFIINHLKRVGSYRSMAARRIQSIIESVEHVPVSIDDQSLKETLVTETTRLGQLMRECTEDVTVPLYNQLERRRSSSDIRSSHNFAISSSPRASVRGYAGQVINLVQKQSWGSRSCFLEHIHRRWHYNCDVRGWTLGFDEDIRRELRT